MTSYKANGDPLEGKIVPPLSYPAPDSVTQHPIDYAYGRDVANASESPVVLVFEWDDQYGPGLAGFIIYSPRPQDIDYYQILIDGEPVAVHPSTAAQGSNEFVQVGGISVGSHTAQLSAVSFSGRSTETDSVSFSIN